MRQIRIFILLISVAFLIISTFPVQVSKAQTSRTSEIIMDLTGQVAKSRNGYIIRSRRENAPSEIYTIRNPRPDVLDEFVKSEKIVSIEARIISGDNVEILYIDGEEYNKSN